LDIDIEDMLGFVAGINVATDIDPFGLANANWAFEVSLFDFSVVLRLVGLDANRFMFSISISISGKYKHDIRAIFILSVLYRLSYECLHNTLRKAFMANLRCSLFSFKDKQS